MRLGRPATAAGVALLAVAFLAPLPAMLKYPTWAQDEGTLLVFPSLMLKGATPNSTFLSIYGPANLYALTAAFFVAGQSVFVERLVAVFYHLVLVSSLTALVWRRRGLFAGLAAGAITVVVGVSYPMMAFAWLGGIAILSLGLLLLDVGLGGRSRRLVVALAGLSLGLAISFRADLSVAVLLILIVLAANRRRAAVFLLPGLLLGLIPTIVSMVQVGPVTVFDDEIVKPAFVIAPQVRLPLPSLGSATGLLMVLCLVIPVVEIVVGTLGWRRSHGAWDDVCVVIVGVVGLSIISNMLHRADLTHVGFVATFTVATAVLVDWTRIAPQLTERRPFTAATRIAWPAAVAFAAVLIATAATGNVFGNAAFRPSERGPTSSSSCPTPAGRFRSTATTNSSTTPASYELPTRAMPGAVCSSGRRICAARSTRTRFSTFSCRVHAGKLLPGGARESWTPPGSGLAGQIAGDDVLILDSAYNSASVAEPYIAYGSNAPNLVVEHDFRRVGQWGPLSLYVRRGWRARRPPFW